MGQHVYLQQYVQVYQRHMRMWQPRLHMQWYIWYVWYIWYYTEGKQINQKQINRRGGEKNKPKCGTRWWLLREPKTSESGTAWWHRWVLGENNRVKKNPPSGAGRRGWR